MTSNKKILLFSFIALSTLYVQKNISATKGNNSPRTSQQRGNFSLKSRNANQRTNQNPNKTISRKSIRKELQKAKEARRNARHNS